MITTAAHRTIITMPADGGPVWYVAAVTKTHSHDVHRIGADHGYPDRVQLRNAAAAFTAENRPALVAVAA